MAVDEENGLGMSC